MAIQLSDIKLALETKAKASLIRLLSNPHAKLVFPLHQNPQISIIMLTYNKAEYTYRCLESILAHADVFYELIIVDNASTDNTRELLARLENVTCILNDTNVYFMRGNNQGVAQAHAPYILLLNNDTELNPHTLSLLLNTIKQHPACGAVGCKLIWPNGILQEAGSMIFNDATCLGYGRGHNPQSPEFSYLRPVDYCSAACLLVERQLFNNLGGLDSYWEPAYYEDTDLCMRIWQAGYTILFQPAASVFHYEYSSSSKETAEQLMQINEKKFLEKWKNQLAHHLPNSPASILLARSKSRKPPILIIDDQIPVQDDGRGYYRSYEMVTTLTKDYQITFFAKQNQTGWQPWLEQLQQQGIEVIYGIENFTDFLQARRNHYVLVIVSRPHNLQQTQPILREYLPHAKVIYDAEALFYKRALLQNTFLGIPSKKECQKMKEDELALFSAVNHIIVVSENEKEAIYQELPQYDKPITIWGHALLPQPSATSFTQRKDILFVGTLLEPNSPNEDAILYFITEIFPLVREKLHCNLIIVGKYPTPKVLAAATHNIEVVGYAPHLQEYYKKCRVFIIPHRFAGGIPFKLSEAMSHGLPAVVSPLIASQFPLYNGEVLEGKNPTEFAAAIAKLYTDENLWQKTRDAALQFISNTHNPEILRQKLRQSVANVLHFSETLVQE